MTTEENQKDKLESLENQKNKLGSLDTLGNNDIVFKTKLCVALENFNKHKSESTKDSIKLLANKMHKDINYLASEYSKLSKLIHDDMLDKQDLKDALESIYKLEERFNNINLLKFTLECANTKAIKDFHDSIEQINSCRKTALDTIKSMENRIKEYDTLAVEVRKYHKELTTRKNVEFFMGSLGTLGVLAIALNAYGFA